MGGAGEVQKKNSRKGKLNEKNSCTPINPKKHSCYGLKKIHTGNLITKKNSCGSKIPLPPHNLSNGPSLIRTNIAYAKRTVRIFSVSPQSRSLFSALFETFCLTARAYLNTQKYGLFCSLSLNMCITSLNHLSVYMCHAADRREFTTTSGTSHHATSMQRSYDFFSSGPVRVG